MSLTITDLNKIAELAKLNFDHQQSQQILNQLNNFFSLVEEMQSVDTTDVEPMAHPIEAYEDVHLHLAADLAHDTENRQANQQNAPQLEQGLFVVPKVIE